MIDLGPPPLILARPAIIRCAPDIIVPAAGIFVPPPFMRSASPVIIGAVNHIADGTDLTTYSGGSWATLGNNITSDDYPVVSLIARSGSAQTFSSASIGGQALTPLIQTSSAQTVVAICIGPKGASGAVSVTFSGICVRAFGSVHPVRNLLSTSARDTAVAASSSVNIDVPRDGAVIAASFRGGTGQTWTSGINEDWDITVESNTGSGGTYQGAQESNRTVEASGAGAVAAVALR